MPSASPRASSTASARLPPTSSRHPGPHPRSLPLPLPLPLLSAGLAPLRMSEPDAPSGRREPASH
ncbi:hypothetical protein ACFPRL_21875 [Pseudoclavibacter helvolus]